MNNNQALQDLLDQIHTIALSRTEGDEIRTQLRKIQEALSRFENSLPQSGDIRSAPVDHSGEFNNYRQQISGILDILQKQGHRITAQEERLARIERLIMEIVTGRTWRTLRMAGDLAKKALSPRKELIKASVLIDHQRDTASEYKQWIREFEQPDEEIIQLKLPSLRVRPLISIVMPTYNSLPADLQSAIESVFKQSYSNWELCIADDGSDRSEVKEMLSRYAAHDARIKVRFQEQHQGISATSNAALRLITGEYVCFLDHDDELSPHALANIADAINRNPNADFLYSDEDKIDKNGKRYDPFFKPDWSPDLLLSENYICHLFTLRKDLLEKTGDFLPECDGSQDYDLALRASEYASHILHIPKILYHWRAGQHSTASTLENKAYALTAMQRALERYCERALPDAKIEAGRSTGRLRLRYPVSDSPRVSIIIASGGKADVLRTNLDSLFAKTDYLNYEVIVIDNSRQDKIEALVSQFKTSHKTLRYIDWRNRPFNYSAINNAAARQCDSPIFLFLNDDTSVIERNWLTSMVELILRKEVGAVGAKLLYPNGRIQHAGVVMGLFDNCGHAFKGLPGNHSHYFDFSHIVRNVSAVTGACLMTKADIFWEVDGFDEEKLAVAFNDVDLCLKIGSRGYRILYTPYAELYHYEAFSKTSKDLIPHPAEVAEMQSKWRNVISRDPFYSSHLTRTAENYSLRISTS